MGRIAKRGTRARPRFYAQFKDLDGRSAMRALKGCRSQEEASKALAKIRVIDVHRTRTTCHLSLRAEAEE